MDLGWGGASSLLLPESCTSAARQAFPHRKERQKGIREESFTALALLGTDEGA